VGCELYAVQEKTFDGTTGRLVVDWKPDLDWTDDTLFYASYAHGFRSGGMNPPLSAGLSALIPQFFDPEEVDAYEIGTKNTLPFLSDEGVLQANITAWYYDYQNYQVSKIFNRTSVNENIPTTLWGIEGEFLYAPDEQWQFSLLVTNTESEIGPSTSVDTRNPTAGRADTVLIKSLTDASNCVLYRTGAAAGVSPADAGVPGFFEPKGPGTDTMIAGSGVPLVNYGSCGPYTPAQTLAMAGLFSTTGGPGADLTGVAVSLEGMEMPLTPNNTIAIGAQYTYPIGTGVDLVFRWDYYWQTETWSRIFNSDPIDLIDAWGMMNAQIELAGEDGWHVTFFATNLLDDREITGHYLTDPSSGLFTNVFVTDPRIIGLNIGAEF
jgi:outer membrane receptor protein involved in Fe transport